MKIMKKFGKTFSACLLAVSLSISGISPVQLVHATSDVQITYTFEGNEKDKAGYAQGTICVSATTDGCYHLFWADDTKALKDYYEINSKLKDELTSRLGGKSFEGRGFIVKSGQKATFTFDPHTAIPADATKIIAVTDTEHTNVSDAVAVFDIPKEKQLKTASGNLLYRFNSYSDIHISSGSWWSKSKDRCKSALDYAAAKGSTFINISGDISTTPKEDEWKFFRDKVKNSSFKGNIWECTGNHELKDAAGKKWFIDYALKTDSDYSVDGNSTYVKDKAYYYKVEKNSGDVFIYLALENKDATSENVFSQTQMDWFQSVIDKYYESGVNIFVSEHAPYQNWSIGEFKYGNKLYHEHLQDKGNTKTFINILKKYKNLIWMNGHTHQDFCIATNYSNENGTACNMIHNPGCGGTTYGYNKSAEDKISNASEQQYHSPEQAVKGKKDGAGYHSQGYYVETYENEIIYHGSDIDKGKIYPEYCYIMEGSRSAGSTPVVTSQPDNTSSPVEAKQRIYFDNSSYNWSNVYCYMYMNKDEKNEAWPGVKMELDQTTGYYYYDVPENLSTGKVIFTQDKTTKTNRYPAEKEPGLDVSGTMLFKEGNTLISYEIPQSPTPVPTTTVVATTVATEPATETPEPIVSQAPVISETPTQEPTVTQETPVTAKPTFTQIPNGSSFPMTTQSARPTQAAQLTPVPTERLS
ncbi:MAG: starch-binding protein, partial [Lachnospiraceae bacterium]|nr:starch-binding protein [Lachnospiraceae bacterium]